MLLNDPTYVEAARVLAERIVREGGGAPSDRIHWVHRHVLGREPAPPVVLALLDLYAQQLGEYAANSDVASQVLTTGASPAPADIRPPELAAWTAVARVLLNLHETITRY